MSLPLTVLYLSCSILIFALAVWTLINNTKRRSNQLFFSYGISIALWIITLYLGFYFAIAEETKLSLIFIRLAYGLSVLFQLFLTLFFYYFPSRKFKLPNIVLFLLWSISIILFLASVFTPLIHTSQIITNGAYIGDVFGPHYLLYIIYNIFHLALVVFLAGYKIAHSSGVNKKKIMLSGVGLFIFSFLGILTNVFLPMFGNMVIQGFDTRYITQSSPAFTLFFIIPTFYSIIKYRFLDIKFIISKTVRLALALIGSIVATYAAYQISNIIFSSNTLIYLNPLILILGIFTYVQVFNLMKYHSLYHLIGGTEVEIFCDSVNELKHKNVIYKTLHEFENDLRNIFHDKLKINFAKISIINEKNYRQYYNLISYFKKYPEALVTKEIELLSREHDETFDFLDELKGLGEVVVPLMNPSKKIIGFFVLGEKRFSSAYSKEEIDALQDAQSSLSLRLTGILFSSELKKEVRRQTENLKRQNEKIKELLHQQADFIAVSAHELRTPLSIALLQTEILEDTVDKRDRQHANVSSARTALSRLQKLVQKLFNVQRHDLNKVGLNLQHIKLKKFIDEIYKNAKPLATKKSITFELENNLNDTLTVDIDPLQMQQVFQNLISNAMKFTPHKGHIILRSGKVKGRIQFCVLDSGEGIPKKMHQAVFTKFRSLHASKGKGIGLGLYLSKKIVELHKGKIWIEESELGGAKFCIQL